MRTVGSYGSGVTTYQDLPMVVDLLHEEMIADVAPGSLETAASSRSFALPIFLRRNDDSVYAIGGMVSPDSLGIHHLPVLRERVMENDVSSFHDRTS